MSTYSDKWEAHATKLEGLNGEAVTRHPGDGSGDVPLTAFAFVEQLTERRFDDSGSERFVRVANIRLSRAIAATLDDRDGWTITASGERWETVRIVLREPSVRVFLERPTSRTVGGPSLTEFTA